MRRGFTYKIVSILLTAAMLAQLCPVSAWAAEGEGAAAPAAELPAGAGDEGEALTPEEPVPGEGTPEAVVEEVPADEGEPADGLGDEVVSEQEAPEATDAVLPEVEDPAGAPQEAEEDAVPEGDPDERTFDVTFNANGGTFADGSTTKVVPYHITWGQATRYSHTDNIDDDGIASGGYAGNLATKDVVTVPGATSLHVTITYAMDYYYDNDLYVFQGAYDGEITRYLDAGQIATYNGGYDTKRTVELDVEGDTVTFGFYSRYSESYYGYYAKVEAEGWVSSPVGASCDDPAPNGSDLVFDTWRTDESLSTPTDLTRLDEATTVYARYLPDAKYSGKDVGVDWCVTKGGVLVIGRVGEEQGWTNNDYWHESWPWTEYSSDIRSVRVDGAVRTGSYCDGMFSGLTELGMADLSGLDTSSVTDMGGMFYECSSLASLDLSGWDTSKVTYMGNMFYGCNALRTISLGDAFVNVGDDTSKPLAGTVWVSETSGIQYGGEAIPSNVADTYTRVVGWNSNGTCMWQIDDDGVLVIKPMNGDEGTLSYWEREKPNEHSEKGYQWHDHTTDGDYKGSAPWAGSRDDIESVRFEGTVHARTCEEMFFGCENLTSVDFEGFDTTGVTSMHRMFGGDHEYSSLGGCSNLVSIQNMDFDTSAVTDMCDAFAGCSSLRSLDTSGWDTSSVTDVSGVFSGCSSLRSLDTSGWDTSSVTDMSQMFAGCSGVRQLEVSDWDTAKVTDMSSMFSGCSRLSALDPGSWDTSSVTDMTRLFSGCRLLKALNLSGWDVSSAQQTNEYLYEDHLCGLVGIFEDCSGLASLDVSGWHNPNLTSLRDVFSGCSSLASLDLSSWDFPAVTDLEGMFYGCSSLRSLDISSLDGNKVVTAGSMFRNCSSLPSVDLSRWNTSKLEDVVGLFYGCTSLSSANLSGWNLLKVDSLYELLSGCASLKSLDMTGWNTQSVRGMGSTFNGCASLTSLDLSGWDTYQVTDMSSMFKGCSSLKSLNLSGWDTAIVTSMNEMFADCVSLSSLDLSGIDTSSLTTASDYEFYLGSYRMMNGVGINQLTLGGDFVFKGAFRNEYNVPLLHVNKSGDTYDTYTKGTWKRKDGTGSALTTKQLIEYHSASRPKTTWVWQGEKFTAKSLAGATVATIPSQLYTGSAIEPKVTVTLDGKTLSLWSDYTVQYQNNTDPGTATAVIKGSGSYTGSIVAPFRITTDTLDAATVAKIPDQKCTGKPLQPTVTVTIGGTTLKQGTDYKVSYKNNTAGGTATVTITGIGDYAGTKTATFKISDKWQRIWGQNGYDTMRAILKTDGVFTTSSVSTVVLASRDSFQDPLAATALAGTFRAPLLLCSKNSLASQTKAELKRLKPSRIIVVGYGSSVSARVASDAKSAAGAKTVTQVKGTSAEARAVAAYNAGKGKWSRTCIIATQNSYKDSLSASPYAYAKKCPIFFVGAKRSAKEGGRLSAATLSAIKKGGFTRIVIVGGPVAVSNYVQTTQLKGKKVERWYGSNGIDTSRVIAQRALGEGMGVSHVAVATTGGYVDALAGAALAGRQNSVLLLANKTGGYGAFDALSAQIKGGVKHGHILGGTAAISEASANHFREAQ